MPAKLCTRAVLLPLRKFTRRACPLWKELPRLNVEQLRLSRRAVGPSGVRLEEHPYEDAMEGSQ